MKLTPVRERFVVHWGEMGSRWGVNRSQAQIHALLYLSSEPLTAEDIAETLGVARSNVSTSLKELQGWGLVNARQVLGDRRDYFVGVQDLWEILRLIVEGRKQREIDPTLEAMRALVEEARSQNGSEDRRLVAMVEFLGTLVSAFAELREIPPAKLIGMASLARRALGSKRPTPKRSR